MHNRAGVVCGVMLFLSLTACASPILEATRTPGADFTGIKRIHVQKLAADERGIDQVIANQLTKMGYLTSTGASVGESDAVVAYQDKWMWDMTMYMIQLDVQVRDGRSQMLLGSGRSWRPSLERRSPEEMADEVLRSIFIGRGQ